MEAKHQVAELIFGRWKSQILHAGVTLGVFEHVSQSPSSAAACASALELDSALTYRLMRALACIGLLNESEGQNFSITDAGGLLCADHPESMRGVALLEEGSVHYAFWKHLPQMIREGKQDGFKREFGCGAFEYTAKDESYRAIFNEAMSSFSKTHTEWALDALSHADLSKVGHVCDVAGGHGHLLCHLVEQHPSMRGTVLELANVIDNPKDLWAGKMGLAERVSYQAGNMFEAVPAADAYTMKMILHDWNDDECVQILKNCFNAAPIGGQIFVIEHLVTPPGQPHFAKLFDIHMLCWGTGRERTPEEYAALLSAAGWTPAGTLYPEAGLMGVVAGRKD